MFTKIGRYNNLIKTILLFCILLFFSFILLLHFTMNLNHRKFEMGHSVSLISNFGGIRENISNMSNNINFTQCCVKDNNGNEFRYSGDILNADDINSLQNNIYGQRFTIDNITKSQTFHTNLDQNTKTWGSIDCDNINFKNFHKKIYRYTFSQYNKNPVYGYFYGNVESSNTFWIGSLRNIYEDIIKDNNKATGDYLSSITSVTSNPNTYSQYRDLANNCLKDSNKKTSQSKIIYNNISNLRESFVEGNISDINSSTINNNEASKKLIEDANRPPCLIPNQDHLNFAWVGGVARYWDDTRSNYRDQRGWGIRSRNGNWNRNSWPRKHYNSASRPNCPTSEYGW